MYMYVYYMYVYMYTGTCTCTHVLQYVYMYRRLLLPGYLIVHVPDSMDSLILRLSGVLSRRTSLCLRNLSQHEVSDLMCALCARSLPCWSAQPDRCAPRACV